MLKSYRVSILIICFFTLAAFLNESGPAQVAGLINSLFVTDGVANTHSKLGLVESFDLPTFILLSTSIICGLFMIAYLKLSSSGKIISVQSARLEQQEVELQQARQVLKSIVSNENIKAELHFNELSPITKQSADTRHQSWVS